eukprot:15440177-Alexandrium_andersonii.AAC.1
MLKNAAVEAMQQAAPTRWRRTQLRLMQRQPIPTSAAWEPLALPSARKPRDSSARRRSASRPATPSRT